MSYEKLENDSVEDVIAGWDSETKYDEDGNETDERLAPEPIQKKSRAFHLYDIVRTLGGGITKREFYWGTTTLNDIWKLIPASDLPRPKNKQVLRDWISSSGVSKGYIYKVSTDVYRIATLQEYERILARNKTANKKYAVKAKARKLRVAKQEAKKQELAARVQERLPVGIESVMPPRAPTPTKPVGKPVVKQPEPKQPEPNTSFFNQYLGSLLGTSVAIVLFYVIVRVI
mgnify:CR=1 FL=1